MTPSSNLGVAIRRQVAHDDRNLMQTGTNRCAQPPGAEVDTVKAIAIGRVHDERLQDAPVENVLGQFFELSFWKL